MASQHPRQAQNLVAQAGDIRIDIARVVNEAVECGGDLEVMSVQP